MDTLVLDAHVFCYLERLEYIPEVWVQGTIFFIIHSHKNIPLLHQIKTISPLIGAPQKGTLLLIASPNMRTHSNDVLSGYFHVKESCSLGREWPARLRKLYGYAMLHTTRTFCTVRTCTFM